MAANSEIDKLDLQILSILMSDAQIPYTEIAKRLEVSGGTVHVRMKKLIAMGVVKGSHLEIDPSQLGYDICAFVGMFLEKGSLYNRIVKQLEEIPEITEIHYTTGRYGIFLKIVSTNTRELRSILNDKVQPIEGIQRTETFISLEESMKRPIQILGAAHKR
ncbi:Lrp/AsnC ligand binding domain-containing protein [Pontibacter sp. G13]|uniref:Lrp/AsnC ligand binding domain-containing protein n=1 Tax=Pontibacter sp. G13 TaxID=3074898 RepID=UPI00288A42C1|nr:Lrp/AsnC ligand binding domain-containing protein [Pontibacter sp. G13]WNJ16915.1 Lrp/AsnC ligand binding domain-containing protein [Pontibacter sp. G13]